MFNKIAIDLTWVRLKKAGGIEAYITNILEGLYESCSKSFSYYLFVAEDNAGKFEKYKENKYFSVIVCPVQSDKLVKRLLWLNTRFVGVLKKYEISVCFEPHYCQPVFVKGIKFITTIHDLQAIHYPEYFSFVRRIWLKLNWLFCSFTSFKIIAISDFVKKDIEKYYPKSRGKVVRVYNSISVSEQLLSFKEVEEKYQISEGQYFYTISALLKHKNVMTLIKMMKEIKEKDLNLPHKLLISGAVFEDSNEIINYIKKNNLSDVCVITGFISEVEKYTLLKKCSVFLFPSVFEGFGMPVIESMMCGVKCITTDRTCLKEVTEGKAFYINDPYDVRGWICKCLEVIRYQPKVYSFPKYNKKNVIKELNNIFAEAFLK